MDGKSLSAAVRAGKNVYGTLIVSPSARWPQALQGQQIDFVFIDTEHTVLDRSQVAWMCHTYKRMGFATIVRIPAPDPYQATMVLDGGADGIVAPYVETVEQARAMRGAVKLRPLKGRRLQEALEGKPLEPELARYLEERNAGNVMVLNIESIPAIEALDEILKVPGLDAVQIGPHDLSCSLGVPEQYDHPKFRDAVRTICSKARAAGVGAAIHSWGSIEMQIGFMKDGVNMLIHAGDILLFRKALKDDVAAIRKGIGDTAGKSGAAADDAI